MEKANGNPRLSAAVTAIVLLMLLAINVTFGQSTNVTVWIAGKLQTIPDVDQLVKAQARQGHMRFDFTGAHPYCVVLSNKVAVLSLCYAQTNGTFLQATVDSKGIVRAKELMSRDVEAIRTMLRGRTTNVVTDVWLGPDGLVGASTAMDKQEGESFYLWRGSSGWKIESRTTWTRSNHSEAKD